MIYFNQVLRERCDIKDFLSLSKLSWMYVRPLVRAGKKLTPLKVGFLSEETQEYLKPSSQPISWSEATAKVIGATSKSKDDLISGVNAKASFKSNGKHLCHYL